MTELRISILPATSEVRDTGMKKGPLDGRNFTSERFQRAASHKLRLNALKPRSMP